MFGSRLLLAALAATSAVATVPPTKSGYKLVWSDNFTGTAGSTVSTSKWNIITGPNNANGELEVYTASSDNHHLTADNTLVIIPKKDGSGGWTSARLESIYTFTPANQHMTIVEAEIRFGTNAMANKQGIWPAFWMLGDSIRHGTSWPECGEIDILETIDGQFTGHGTVHCDVSPGGICDETTGLGGPVSFSGNGWQTWSVEIDRTASAWQQNSITFKLNGNEYWQVTGATIGDLSVWQTLVASPLYIIVNVAVGGDWPGDPNAQTMGGAGSEMEVSYIAQYQSN
ncbi:putative endo-1,3(4)-beta-glucanase [Xylariaceae sp. FL0255]|nr:putative endo-1,3(4)-beta-glucanase [Xylariaceae sp. FL0255]